MIICFSLRKINIVKCVHFVPLEVEYLYDRKFDSLKLQSYIQLRLMALFLVEVASGEIRTIDYKISRRILRGL